MPRQQLFKFFQVVRFADVIKHMLDVCRRLQIICFGRFNWEIDTVVGKGHKGALVTIVERVTKFTRSCRVASKSAACVTAATITLLTPYKKLVLSITADNGKEFAYHEEIAAKLQCDVYFANPYCSWERGLNENTNGLIRQSFPKHTDLSKVSDAAVRQAIDCLNKRPR